MHRTYAAACIQKESHKLIWIASQQNGIETIEDSHPVGITVCGQ